MHKALHIPAAYYSRQRQIGKDLLLAQLADMSALHHGLHRQRCIFCRAAQLRGLLQVARDEGHFQGLAPDHAALSTFDLGDLYL